MANHRPWYLSIPLVAIAGLRLFRVCVSSSTPSYDFNVQQPQIDYASLLGSLDAGSHSALPPPPPVEHVRMVTDGTNVLVADPAGDGVTLVPRAGGPHKLIGRRS